MSTQSRRAAREGIAGLLESPVVGMAPWIIFGILSGPGRFEVSVGIALAVAVVLVAAGRWAHPGSSWKLLELADLVFFTGLAIIGAVADDRTLRWLETYSGEVSNLALVAIAFGSMAVRRPFTLAYAREQTDPSVWDTPQFLRANQVITGVWGLAFLVGALTGGYGDLVLHDPDNLWTAWIIPVLALIAAVRFTLWYPEALRARAQRDAGRPGPEPPGLNALLAPLAGLLVPVGALVLIFEDGLWWLGVGLVVAGVLATKALHTAT
ncbi:hypothetical protein [Streptomyces sp. NRRL S-87]|uniref:hypothetical protein n=1 Tax=Streptomyces sp. NRRL S-87 TaxID=1463920 RepID=UPI0004C1BCE9|nr:hypothetical protein [Streptomyces sp. NRRL S-87]